MTLVVAFSPIAACFSHCRYLGLEVAQAAAHGSTKRADVLYDGRTLPLHDASADAVLCTQVLEHVIAPTEFLQELHRITRPGGKLLLTVPFVWDEHEQPYDFARYSSFGLRHLLRCAGFRVIAETKTLANAAILAQLWLSYLYKVVVRWPRLLRIATFLVVATPINVIGLALQACSPRNPDLYLDNVVLYERTTDE